MAFVRMYRVCAKRSGRGLALQKDRLPGILLRFNLWLPNCKTLIALAHGKAQWKYTTIEGDSLLLQLFKMSAKTKSGNSCAGHELSTVLHVQALGASQCSHKKKNAFDSVASFFDLALNCPSRRAGLGRKVRLGMTTQTLWYGARPRYKLSTLPCHQ